MKTLKEKLLEANIKIDTRYSDLFCEASPEAHRIIREYRLESAVHFKTEGFLCQITKRAWIEIPLMNYDYFNKRA
jgi:hypothetical protein